MAERIIMDSDRFLRTISRITHEILEKHPNIDDLVIIGIKRRGAEIAALIKQKIFDLTNIDLPASDLDITFYRDDLEYVENQQRLPVYKGASNKLDIQDKTVILVDDVLFTGRTIRAALDALVDFGRAARVELVILVDRGHRELPIRADYVGKNIPTNRNEQVKVHTLNIDQCYGVSLISAE